MEIQTMHQEFLLPIVPMDDSTRDMLYYAASPDGRSKIERAQQEIRDCNGIVATSEYFDDMNLRVAARAVSGQNVKS